MIDVGAGVRNVGAVRRAIAEPDDCGQFCGIRYDFVKVWVPDEFGEREGGWWRLAPFFDYTPAIRKVVYTTNTIESLSPHRTIKPLTQLSGHASNHLSSHLLWSGPFIPCNCNEWLIHTPKGQTTHVAIRQGGTVSE